MHCNWYVIKSLSRSEKKTTLRLSKLGVVCFLPLIKTLKQWSDRKKKIEEPLIPGIIFVFCEENELINLYNVQGVHSILKYLNKPAIVKDVEIENLKILTNQSLESINKENFIQIVHGDIVEVIKGPFIGLIGSCVKEQRHYKLLIKIDSLSTSFSINISRSFVRLLKKN